MNAVNAMPQRQYPRYAHAAAVTIRRATAAVGGVTKNVSRGGLCAVVREALPVGESITVELALLFEGNATSEALVLPARIVWSTALDDAFQIGVSFRALDARQASHLDLCLSFLAARPDHRPPSRTTDDPFGG